MTAIFQSLLNVVTFCFTLSLTLAIALPLMGTLVRFRANYNPKGLQLDGEGGVQPHTGPIVTSYFSMMGRVKRLEGWAGLYKGLMPTLAATMLTVVFITMLPGLSRPHGHSKYSTPIGGPLAMIGYGMFTLAITLPVVIITNRAITTPHKLPWLNPIYSLRVLLTATERRRPWILFLTPGLFASEAASLVYIIVILHPIRRLLFPSMADAKPGDGLPKEFTLPRLSVYLLVVMISTGILSPLEVISTRLSIQRNHAASGFSAVAQEDEIPEETLEYSGAEEDVIGLRAEDDPYDGVVDCGKRIVQEEGYKTLYRAWWLVFIGVLFGGL